jgi:hypothetical protein
LGYSASLKIPLPKDKIFQFFYDLERWFRLNPQWEVLSAEGCANGIESRIFNLKVRYDRTDEEIDYSGTVEEIRDGELLTIRLNAAYPRLITIKVIEDNDVANLHYEEVSTDEPIIEEKRELILWVKSIADYLLIQERKTMISSVWKWLIDKFWLKMSPSGRRISLFIIVIETAAFGFFILLIIWLLIFKKI